ncbi:AHL_G0028290.mRNA.1.CDS.1 [Saccharomyces cerevisiae]|nr:Kre9p [Saccharomyces cerevisiae YJM1252]CAI4556641.1 AVB_G0028580.mRNA.1.CDS.1 [Saccharomyces cerevisiae]CAI4886320.1 AHL_G0028290.mRNA.1.CDS.1 [Saccharomyces cerevisiae]CAI6728693.1 AHL_G0028290.mRNA.1.CDS.1 [Saccharomyces cerevisiae]CAI7169130.1 AVB_G0028580.mRNA.1.CDS.1 [Saccharomyces cerevisiae]
MRLQRNSIICALVFLVSCVLGDVNVVSPNSKATFSPSGGVVSIPVEWMDNGAYPPLSKITYFTLSLCTGPNTNINCVATIASKVSPSDLTQDDKLYSYTAEFASTLTGNGQYYIQVYAQVDGQGNTIHYTPRFELTSMGGTTAYTYSGTIEPTPQTSIQTTTTNNAQATTIDSRSFTVPYTKQTGTSRFAPMQMQPNTKVTATTWTRKFATSAVTYYSTFGSLPEQATTITPGWSYTISSGVNYATPASMPSDNGGWYKPSKRLSLSARKINMRKV